MEVEKDWQDARRSIEHLDVSIVLDETTAEEAEDKYIAMSYQEYYGYETLKTRKVLEENYNGDEFDYTTCPDKCIIVDQDKYGKWVEMTYEEHRTLYNKDWKQTMDKSRYAVSKVVDRPYREQDENGEWVDMTYQEYREWQKKDIQPVSFKKRLEARQRAAAAAAATEEANNDPPPPGDDKKPPPPEAEPEQPNPVRLWRMRNSLATSMNQGLPAFSSLHNNTPKKGPLAFQSVMLSNSKNTTESWPAVFEDQEVD